MAEARWLDDYLTAAAPQALGGALRAIAEAAVEVAALMAEARATPDRASEVFAEALAGSEVSVLSIPGAGSRALGGAGSVAAAVAPLLPADPREVGQGSLFSIYAAGEGPEATFLRSGTEQLAAGCIVYGADLSLALTLGAGSVLFRRDASGFRLAEAALAIPESTGEFAANAAEYRHWDAAIRRFVDDFLAGAEGPRARDFDMRWTGSLPADALRILTRGGVYLSPHGTARPLDLVHHARPVALLAEQAGGRATDGLDRLLEIVPDRPEMSVPLVFGAAGKVALLTALHGLPDSEVSPLFAQRGLFRL